MVPVRRPVPRTPWVLQNPRSPKESQKGILQAKQIDWGSSLLSFSFLVRGTPKRGESCSPTKLGCGLSPAHSSAAKHSKPRYSADYTRDGPQEILCPTTTAACW